MGKRHVEWLANYGRYSNDYNRTGAVPAGLSFNTSTGAVSVNAGTPAGTYTFDYTICEVLNPANCDTAQVTVNVAAAPIVANNDTTATPVNGMAGGTAIPNVLANDTLNGAAITAGSVTVSVARSCSGRIVVQHIYGSSKRKCGNSCRNVYFRLYYL
ncbi:putative Ig domain-containing protein [Flavobacterium lindanitolerans]|nr:putative Ig domain-containing protein [Flavobacterium lindanitolerans]